MSSIYNVTREVTTSANRARNECTLIKAFNERIE